MLRRNKKATRTKSAPHDAARALEQAVRDLTGGGDHRGRPDHAAVGTDAAPGTGPAADAGTAPGTDSAPAVAEPPTARPDPTEKILLDDRTAAALSLLERASAEEQPAAPASDDLTATIARLRDSLAEQTSTLASLRPTWSAEPPQSARPTAWSSPSTDRAPQPPHLTTTHRPAPEEPTP